MDSYQDFVERLVSVGDAAKGLAAPDPASGEKIECAADAPAVLVCSPHPDDECIVGLMALRLQREAGMRVVNLGVTLGSNKGERPRRRGELEDACAYLGWDLRIAGSEGLDDVTRAARRDDPESWTEKVAIAAAAIRETAPAVMLFPHERDWNGTHEGVNVLMFDALACQDAGFETWIVETEFWHPMDAPNLMVEASTKDLGVMTATTALHVGEVARNPYHLLLPAWMQDNVRRGGERVGGQGGAPPDFEFATLYRLRRWAGAAAQETFSGGRFIASDEKIDALLA